MKSYHRQTRSAQQKQMNKHTDPITKPQQLVAVKSSSHSF